MVQINSFGAKKISDIQVFEYADTLSLPVDLSKFGKSHIGDVVQVGGLLGVLVTEIAPSAQDQAKLGQDPLWNPLSKPTWGNNGPGYASVRISGGVFKLQVTLTGAGVEPGALIYAKPAANGKMELTNDKATGTAGLVGYAYSKVSSTGAQTVPVILAR
jgi:predicted RecA/RadA family phage recombinase|nr:MAG TPA: hypothetical protein [Caudoviricetes sp.]